MKSKLLYMLILSLVNCAVALNAFAELSPSEANQLGDNLTLFGAEKAGNNEGTIPAYTGGLKEENFPISFIKDSGRWTNPYPNEKPLFSITAANMARYKYQLSETSKALLKKYPTYRMDIYPSHRSVAYPDWVLKNIVNNASAAKLVNDGLTVEGAFGGIPFPIPKSGNEVMWNHMLVYNGYPSELRGSHWYVDTSGHPIKTVELEASMNSDYYNPAWNSKKLKDNSNSYVQTALHLNFPPNAKGNAAYSIDTLDPVNQPRRAWTYSAASRRIRISPDLEYDTPIGAFGGIINFDDSFLYQGRLDLFDFKLIGKREMFIPYNNYQLVFESKSEQLLTPNHIDPKYVRWELHRVWVVEATRKPGVEHKISRRVFYFDEDWSGAGMSDSYSRKNQLSKGMFMALTPLYDIKMPLARCYWAYDLLDSRYALGQHFGDPGLGFKIKHDNFAPLTFTPDSLPNRAR